MFATLTTSATVANRRSIFTVDDGTNTIFESASSSIQTASLAWTYSWAATGADKGVADTRVLVMIPPHLMLPAGYRIRTSTVNIQVGDDYSAPVLYVVRYVF